MIQKHRQENISVQGGESKQVSERRSLKDIVPRAANTLCPTPRHSVKQWWWSPPTCHPTSSVPVKKWQAKNSRLSGASAWCGPPVCSVCSAVPALLFTHPDLPSVHPHIFLLDRVLPFHVFIWVPPTASPANLWPKVALKFKVTET